MSRAWLTRLLETGSGNVANKGNSHLVAVAVEIETFKTERDHRLDALDRNPALRLFGRQARDSLL